MSKLAGGVILAIVFALAAIATAGAQGPDLRIAELDCDSNPELVVIENQGDADQALAGWRLQSEEFDPSVMGDCLVAGASNFI